MSTSLEDYIVGDKPRVRASFYAIDTEVLTDPSSIFAMVKKPDGTETSYQYGVDPEVVRESAGVYNIAILLDAAGHWFVRWKGIGTLVGASETRIIAGASAFSAP